MVFRKGVSGNPAGRAPGARHKATVAAEALLDGEAEGLTRKAIERALEATAWRFGCALSAFCRRERIGPCELSCRQ